MLFIIFLGLMRGVGSIPDLDRIVENSIHEVNIITSSHKRRDPLFEIENTQIFIYLWFFYS